MRGNRSILVALVILGAMPVALGQQPTPSTDVGRPASVAPAKPQAPTIPPYNESKTKAALDGRLESLKTALQMTPAQKDLWAPVRAAIREINKETYQRRMELAVLPAPVSLLDALSRLADDQERRAPNVRKFVAAAKPFAASLTDVQRKRLPDFLGLTGNSSQQLIFELVEDETSPAR